MVRALLARDFPINLRENAPILELYKLIVTSTFQIKKCYLGFSKFKNNSENEKKIVSYYPALELVKVEPKVEEIIDLE